MFLLSINYLAFFAAQRFLSAATILALPSGVIPPFYFTVLVAGAALTTAGAFALIFAQRALAAAAIFGFFRFYNG